VKTSAGPKGGSSPPEGKLLTSWSGTPLCSEEERVEADSQRLYRCGTNRTAIGRWYQDSGTLRKVPGSRVPCQLERAGPPCDRGG